MSNTRNITGPQAAQYKRPQVTVGMSVQQESIMYGRAGRQSRRYY